MKRPSPQVTPRGGPSIPADPRVLDRLREVLLAAGYTEQRLWPAGRESVLGEAEAAVTGGSDMGEQLSTLARLFLTHLGTGAEEAAAALAPLALSDLAAGGVVEIDRERVRSPPRIEPFDGLFLACDHTSAGPAPPDVVGGVNPFARLLATLAIRRPVGATLDLGTGCGVQALLAARHSGAAVGVDLNPRALAFAAFNARLNAMDGVECVKGAGSSRSPGAGSA